MSQAKRLTDLGELAQFEAVALTGGEPIWWPNALLNLTLLIKSVSNAKLFLYAARWPREGAFLIHLFDGIQFTIHGGQSCSRNVEEFERFQKDIPMHTKKSYRLYILPEVSLPVRVLPYLYTRIESKPWQAACKIPENETLFMLDSKVWESCRKES